MKRENSYHKKNTMWFIVIIVLVVSISVMHYTTSTHKWQYHLLFMQAYFIPIIMAAFLYGIRGGLGTAVAVSIIYFPHIMLQWGGLVENNLMRFLQILLFNVIGYVTGLQAQREMEETLRYQRAAAELERSLNRLRQQSEKLAELEDQIRFADRLSVVGELTASLAHEIRNPLGSIRGAVEILRDQVPEEQKNSEFFEILIKETDRLSNVLENYLNFTRRKGQHESHYDIREIISNLTMMLLSQARRRQIEIVCRLPENLPTVSGDPNHLWQILINLVLNAMQAMQQPGKIEILVHYEGRNDEQSISITVCDEGPGIDPAKLNEIFQPFYTTKSSGTGLGLAIVRRLAEQNQWKISAANRESGGAEFKLTI